MITSNMFLRAYFWPSLPRRFFHPKSSALAGSLFSKLRRWLEVAEGVNRKVGLRDDKGHAQLGTVDRQPAVAIQAETASQG